MRINTNMNALNAHNQMTKNTALSGNSMNKISSGLRINKAGDDAAGLAIADKMRSQIRGLDQAGRNVQDGISMIQTAEGAMEEVNNISQRMRELAVQSSSETNTGEDRTKIVEELTQLHQEIDRIAGSTKFNGQNLLNGDTAIGKETVIGLKPDATNGTKFTITGIDYSKLEDGNTINVKTEIDNTTDTKITVTVGSTTYTATKTGGTGVLAKDGSVELTADDGSKITLVANAATTAGTGVDIGTVGEVEKDIEGTELKLQVGANTDSSQNLKISIQSVTTEALGLDKETIEAMKVAGSTGTDAANGLIDKLDVAIAKVSTSRANLGASQNRLEYAQNNLTTTSENLTAAESRIRDVDIAKEMMNLSKLNILTQASQAMMGQAKSQPEGVLQLLR